MDKFTEGYLECALWSSSDDAGNPLDQSDAQLSDDARMRMASDCAKFQADNSGLLARASEFQSSDCQGYDFWLTRNGHGAGFWDGDYPKELGDALTRAAKKFGECDLYLGDDGKIYAQ